MLRAAFFTLLLFCVSSLSAQTIICGEVRDEADEPIVGANVFLANTFDGTSTDIDGQFRFETSETGSGELQVSYISYQPFAQSIELDSDSIFFTIRLQAAPSALKEVVITAGAFEAGDEGTTEVLNSIDIATTAGATADITGVLNTLPGTQRVGETGQLFVRGGAASETRTFMDGLYVQNPFNSSVSNMPARGRFSPFLFKGTSFSTGGYSAEYGQALSSALILNTQDLAPETVTSVSLMSVGLGLGHTQRWENSSLAVSADYTNLAPYVGLVDQNIEWEKPVISKNGQVIFRHKTSETGLFKAFASSSTSDLALRYPDRLDVTRKNPLSLSNNYHFAKASFEEILGEKWSIFVGGAYSYNEDNIIEQFSLQTEEQSAQTRARLNYYWNNDISLKFGAEYLYNAYDEVYTDYDATQFPTLLQENYAATFVEADVYFTRKLVGRIGGRLEHSGMLGQVNFAPRLSMAYKTSDDAQLSFAYGHFYQTPEKELLRYSAALDFEQAEHYILNYQIVKGDRTFRIEGYYKNYRNLVRFDSQEPWITENSGDGYARGFDVFYRDRETFKLADFWLSYSFLDTERLFRDFPVQATPRFASKHNFSAVLKQWISDWNTTIGATYTFSSPRPFNDPNVQAFNASRTKPFHDLSVNASYLFELWGNFTILHLSATNILGIENTFGHQFSQQPNATGEFDSIAIRPPAKRFFFVGLFVSIGQNRALTKDDL